MIYRFGDIFNIIDGDRGVNYPKEGDFFDEGYCLFLNAGNVTKTGWSFNKISFISKEKDSQLRKGRIERGDTVFTTRGTIGNAAFYGNGIKYNHIRINSGMVILKAKDKQIIDDEFIYYLVTSPVAKKKIELFCSGSAQPQLPIKDFIKIKFNLPSLKIQKKIVSIIGSYDNLIENNNRRIRLLEQMAENLYKEWFVRFRFPGHEKAEFESGLPKGWSVKRMADFCYVTDGTHDTPKPVEDGIPLITGKCISNGFIDFDVAYNISAKDHDNIKKRSGLSGGDILFSNIGTVGNCCIVDYHREFSVKNVIIFKPNDISKTAYLYYWMLSDSMQNVFSTQTNGASQQFVGLTFMRRYKILVPEQRILFAFGEKINPLVEQKKKLHRINQNLSRQRDLLLPRLMSGKLEVKV